MIKNSVTTMVLMKRIGTIKLRVLVTSRECKKAFERIEPGNVNDKEKKNLRKHRTKKRHEVWVKGVVSCRTDPKKTAFTIGWITPDLSLCLQILKYP